MSHKIPLLRPSLASGQALLNCTVATLLVHRESATASILRLRLLWFLIPLAVCGLAGLSVACSSPSQSAGATSAKLPVVTTFYPLQHLAQRIGGDRANVIGLVPPGVEPHDWEPTPQDITSINKASVFIYQGAGLETWAARTVASLPPDKPIVVEATEGFALKPGTPEEEEERVSSESSAEPHLDPHVWLNPQLYKKQAQAVRDALVKADPKGETAYGDNLASLEKDLDELDSEMEQGLSSCQRHTIVTSHAAFAYLADRYGLEQLAVTGLSPDAEPSPARLREIIQQVRDEGATHIFFETLVSPAVSETVAKEVGAQTLVLDPIEGLTPEEITGRADYFSIQRQNLANLRIALGCL